MRKIITIKVQSANDIITNSSSEVITLKAVQTKEELQALLQSKLDEFCKNYPDEERGTGMGWVLEVDDFRDRFHQSFAEIPYSKWKDYTEEMHAIQYVEPIEELRQMYWVHIDEGFVHTIKFIEEELGGQIDRGDEEEYPWYYIPYEEFNIYRQFSPEKYEAYRKEKGL